MSKRVVLTDSKTRRVMVAPSSTRRIALDDIAKKLGAEPTGIKLSTSGSPVNFATVREVIFYRLRSTGGRPGLQGAEPKKIPLTDQDWKLVKQVAKHISGPGFKPSVGQVAGVLLSIVLHNVNGSLEAIVKRDLKAGERSAAHS